MKETTMVKWGAVIGSIVFLGFVLVPFIYMVITSISTNPEYLSSSVPFTFTLQHYKEILTTPTLHFIDYFKNSLIVSALSAFISVIIAGLAAYAITRLEIKGAMMILFAILALSMFPQISIVSYLFKIMGRLGWINTYWALLFPYIAWILPLSLWILVSYFSQIPRELDKAALIDGCTHWQILFKVIAPVAAPGLFSTALLAFVFAFNEFMFALMLTTDHNARTIPVGIAMFQGLHGEIPWGKIMAASALTTSPVVVATLLFQRYIIAGLTRGAVKG